MNRINVYTDQQDDPYGPMRPVFAGWFDLDTAEAFDEDTRWDGSNNISVPTGSQWGHQKLFRTAKGRWVLHSWSQWQGSTPHWGFVSEGSARDWLLENDHDDAVKKHFGEIEPERGPGRPEVGKPINVRLGDELLAAVDAKAERLGVPRAEVIRTILADQLA
jgi:Ribbon-helix-helix protein, copG family